MMMQQTLNTLNQLKLFGMARAIEQRLKSVKQAGLSHEEFVGLLVQDEKTDRENRRLTRLLRQAHLRQNAALEDVDTKLPRGLNKQVLVELSATHWIEGHSNVLLTGPTGIGKSFLACALGNFAARQGFPVLYLRASRLFETLLQARADGTHLKVMTRLAKARMLIIDDFLLSPLTDTERKDFLEIVEDRYAEGSTVITSQCPPKQWHENIGDPTLADAICDRLFHNAIKVELKGDSVRKRNGRDK